MNTVKFRNIMDEEGGDNWPSIQLKVGDFDKCDCLTYADFEKYSTQKNLNNKKFCKQK